VGEVHAVKCNGAPVIKPRHGETKKKQEKKSGDRGWLLNQNTKAMTDISDLMEEPLV